MRRYALIDVPYHLGVADESVGGGPLRVLEAGAGAIFAMAGVPPAAIGVRYCNESEPELERIVCLNRRLAAAVSESSALGNCPIVLAGNCGSAIGTLAGLHGDRKGIVWLDAHGDFNTPETSVSGLLEGMSLAIATGHCHQELALRSGLDTPVHELNTLLLGVRDLDQEEESRLRESPVIVRRARELDDADDLLSALAERVDIVYLHIDVDFLDAEESPGVNWRSPGGLPVAQAETLIETIAAAVPVGAAAVTNYNPENDPDGRSTAAILRLLEALRRGLDA